MAVRTTPPTARVSLDRSIERMRKQLAELAPFLGKGKLTRSLEEFDLETERLIGDLLGQTSSLLHAYEYAELGEAAGLIARRLGDLYRRDSAGRVPALRADSPFQQDPDWEELAHFYEYFHAETGQGLGAAHQTGWTGLIANLVMRRYRRDVTSWSGPDSADGDSRVHELA